MRVPRAEITPGAEATGSWRERQLHLLVAALLSSHAFGWIVRASVGLPKAERRARATGSASGSSFLIPSGERVVRNLSAISCAPAPVATYTARRFDVSFASQSKAPPSISHAPFHRESGVTCLASRAALQPFSGIRSPGSF